MRHKKLTGKKRLRCEDEKLILQVQEKGLDTKYIGGNISSEWVTYWRDAKVEDATTAYIIDLDIEKIGEGCGLPDYHKTLKANGYKYCPKCRRSLSFI